MAPSTLLVLILYTAQVYFIFDAHGLTLPLQTVTTKCESITKRTQKLNQERKVNEKLSCENLASDLTCSPQLPLDSYVQKFAKPTESIPVVKSQEGLYQEPILQKDASLTNNICPNVRLNVIKTLSELSNKPTTGNSMSSGLIPPVAVSNTVTSLSPPNLIPSESLNSCSKTTFSTNSILENCMQAPKAVNSLTMSNQIQTFCNDVKIPCNSNSYASNLKASLPALSTPTCDTRNINLSPTTSQVPIIFDKAPKSQNLNLLGQPDVPVSVTPPNDIKLPVNSLNSLRSGVINVPIEIPKYISSNTLSYPFHNTLDQIGNVPPNMLPKSCDFVSMIPDPNSNLRLEPSCPFSTNILKSVSPGLPPLMFDNPLTSSILNSTVSQQKSSCLFNSLNMKSEQDIPTTYSSGSLVPQQHDTSIVSSSGICTQSNYALTSMPCSLNSNLPPFCCHPTPPPILTDLFMTETPLMTAPNIFPNVQMYPPSSFTFASTNGFSKLDNVTKENSETCNNSPVAVNQISPINKYFKDVRAATAKLQDFISSFSSKFGSKKVPQEKSFTAPSQKPLVQSDYMPHEKKMEPSLLVPCSRTLSPSPDFQQNIIPFQESVTSKISTTAPTQSCVDSSAPSAPQLVPLTFKAPIVPKTINAFNFPICSTSAPFHNFQDKLASLPSCNYLPNPLTNLLSTNPSNPFANFGSYRNLPDGPLTPPPCPPIPVITSLGSNSLPSVINRPTLDVCLGNPSMTTYKEISSPPLPDILSSILTKFSYACDSPNVNPSPYLSSVSVNIQSDCDHDSCIAPSGINECTLDSLTSSLLSSPIASFLNLEPTLDESQLDLCCKNLENMIAVLESSMNFNAEVDCELDSFNMLSSL